MLPTDDDLKEIFKMKYGEPDSANWSPALRWRFNYFTPDDYYEALVNKLVSENCDWLDVGCGRFIFPTNHTLARLLADRSGNLTGIDPDITIEENSFVHNRIRLPIDEYRGDEKFDLVTLRMVAEHIEHPEKLIETLSHCVRQKGKVVIYTVNKFSPVPLITDIVPFGLHNPVKKVLWRTESKDTFPTCFKMNTRKTLENQFSRGGFKEVMFAYVDDCRSFARFKFTNYAELGLRKTLNTLGIKYPENCLIGVYERE